MNESVDAMVRFPWGPLMLSLVAGLPALAIGAFIVTGAMSFVGPRYDVLIMNGHVVGDLGDLLMLLALASGFGAVAVVCGIRFRQCIELWRNARGSSRTPLTRRCSNVVSCRR